MFSFSAGTSSTDGLGYTFWLDEIRFEKLGNLTQPKPAISNGIDKEVEAYNNTIIEIRLRMQRTCYISYPELY